MAHDLADAMDAAGENVAKAFKDFGNALRNKKTPQQQWQFLQERIAFALFDAAGTAAHVGVGPFKDRS